MTGLELHVNFLQKLQEHIDKTLDIRTIDIQFYIQRGAEVYTDKIIDKFKGQEELRRRLGALLVQLPLLKTVGYSKVGIHTNSEEWKIPTNVRHVVDEMVKLQGITNPVPVKPVTNDYYNKQSKNPFKTPYDKLVWRMEAGGNKHELIKHTNADIEIYYITYIQNPEVISISSQDEYDQIPEGFQHELIDEAVTIALETLQLSSILKNNTVQQ